MIFQLIFSIDVVHVHIFNTHDGFVGGIGKTKALPFHFELGEKYFYVSQTAVKLVLKIAHQHTRTHVRGSKSHRQS